MLLLASAALQAQASTPAAGQSAGQAVAQSAAPAWVTIVSKLLEWPFLFFLALLVLTAVFRANINALLARRDITFSWGDRKIRLRELSTNVDKELDPIREELDALRQAIADIQRLKDTAAGTDARDTTPGEAESRMRAAESRIMDALAHGKFNWRSLERLAAIAGVTEDDCRSILLARPDVELSMGKSGRPIAGLRSRVRP